MRLEIPCPKCKVKFEYDIDDSRIPPNPSIPIAVPHKDHILMVYIDKNGRVLGIDETFIDSRFF